MVTTSIIIEIILLSIKSFIIDEHDKMNERKLSVHINLVIVRFAYVSHHKTGLIVKSYDFTIIRIFLLVKCQTLFFVA